ncbi:MAG TPA: NAD(P)-dependent oxidoreductase [Acidobacteriota bacterium]|nr:NAD(P)-dependent oxidoreductase [Acidobacteriota bacterium]
MEKPIVGFIGLGIMGLPMASNLVKAGYRLVVFNRTREKAEAMAGEFVQVASSPAEVASRCQMMITIVTDSAAVEEVIAGPQGLLAALTPESIVIDMSTISPAVEQQLDSELKKVSATLVDAPVSGGDIGAQQGTLAIMAGGDRDAFEKSLPLFQAMGKTITYCGPVGSGQLTKLCNQILVSVNLLAVTEAITFARKTGLNPETMIEAVKGGAAGSWQLANLGPKIADRDFAPGFMIDLMQKDLRLVLEAAGSSSVCLSAASSVHQLLNAAQAKGLGKEGTQALMKVVETGAAL